MLAVRSCKSSSVSALLPGTLRYMVSCASWHDTGNAARRRGLRGGRGMGDVTGAGATADADTDVEGLKEPLHEAKESSALRSAASPKSGSSSASFTGESERLGTNVTRLQVLLRGFAAPGVIGEGAGESSGRLSTQEANVGAVAESGDIADERVAGRAKADEASCSGAGRDERMVLKHERTVR